MTIKKIIVDGDPSGDLTIETGSNKVSTIKEDDGGRPEADVVWFKVMDAEGKKLSQHNWRYVKTVEYE